MTLKDFRQLNVLDYQIRDLKEKIARAQAVAEKCTVSFSAEPKGSGGQNSKEQAYLRLIQLKADLIIIQGDLNAIMRAYDRIDDRLVKTALNLKYDVEHLGRHPISWTAVAMIIGGGNTGDGIRMCCKRYLEKHV